MESWHLIAAWATCAALAGISYASTVEPKRLDPRMARAKRKATATTAKADVGVRVEGIGQDGGAENHPFVVRVRRVEGYLTACYFLWRSSSFAHLGLLPTSDGAG